MKARREPLERGRLHFDSAGVPASERYGDVYHARAGALEQARHVFIHGNDLPQRWRGRHAFTVCETGFGLGNNFLALWQAWRHDAEAAPRLHVVSFEGHPLSREDLAAALAVHTGEIRQLADALLEAWPPLLPGLHRLEFEQGSVTLTLAFGKVEYLARQVEAGVDAFFLDGFSPQLNPAMWSRELFGQLVRMANKGATAATWCTAGQVRRDLSAAGFIVSRAPGFGGKRDMSRAVLRGGLGRTPVPRRRENVLVIGGGLAGAGVAHSLSLRGHAVTVLDPAFADGPAGVHRGHRCAAMTPALSRDDNPMSRLSRAGILLGRLRWKALPGVVESCGSLMRIANEDSPAWRAALCALGHPPEWASWCEASDTLERCGVSLGGGGVWLPAGALLRPERLVASLLSGPSIQSRAGSAATLRRSAGRWQAVSADGVVLAEAPLAVVAAASGTPALLRGALQTSHPKLERMQLMGGQVGYFRAGAVPNTHAIVAGAGYWLPADDGIHVGGSTYGFDAKVSEATRAGFQQVARKVATLLNMKPDAFEAAGAQPDGWAGWRVAVSDHLPVIGPVDHHATLWTACAYGSRGLSWMTLAGEIMAASLAGEPMPVERELLRAIRPR